MPNTGQVGKVGEDSQANEGHQRRKGRKCGKLSGRSLFGENEHPNVILPVGQSDRQHDKVPWRGQKFQVEPNEGGEVGQSDSQAGCQ